MIESLRKARAAHRARRDGVCPDCGGYTSDQAVKVRPGWQWHPGKFCSCPFDERHEK